MMINSNIRVITALAWCLVWNQNRNINVDKLTLRHQIQQSINNQLDTSPEVKLAVEQAKRLYEISDQDFPKTLDELHKDYLDLWEQETPIGLVYGGATKIKQYVFEAAKLPDIRGASALLDRINLFDLPKFFGDGKPSKSIEEWLDNNFPDLRKALIPELIIYSTGGNILAFCPAAFVNDLAQAIEKRYTHETLTANSCAVGDTFKLLEFRFGLLSDNIADTFWFDKYEKKQENPIIKAYFDQPEVNDPFEKFKNRKNFNELVGKLANQFTQRRNGNDFPKRPSRCYPPMFETHPYIQRDESDRRSAIMDVDLPNSSFLSEPLARKRLVGEIAKRESSHAWYDKANLEWKPFDIWIPSWVKKFEDFLKQKENQHLASQYYDNVNKKDVEEARSLREIASASKPSGFVAYIYADGNNMGGYIRQKIKTPQDYQLFSNDVFDATEKSVYAALANYLHPYEYTPDAKSSRSDKKPVWIHPFEIITIGGDDVLLVVPANKALEIAKMIGDQFEEKLLDTNRYSLKEIQPNLLAHRYNTGKNPASKCLLSMSTGVLITAQDTPIYYADKLVSQLLKSAKKYAKDLKKDHKYYSGTVDFLVMKAVTMISSNIKDFREQGLIKNKDGQTKLKLYASPYTLYELGGLLETVKAFKQAEFPRSQLYQIRSLLERGKRTAILNYRYFRIRLANEQAKQELKTQFESAWCQPKDSSNNGNLAPWMSLQESNSEDVNNSKMTYETIWRELVDLYPFIEQPADNPDESTPSAASEVRS